MNIKLEQQMIKLPLVHPFETSFGIQKDKYAVIIKLTDDEGNVGWGETIADEYPGYSYETKETVWLIQRDFLIPQFLTKFDHDFPEIADVYSAFQHVRGHNFAKTGLEAAYWSLRADRERKSLGQYYGSTKNEIPTGVSIGIQESIKELISRIEFFVDQGYKRIKMKIKPGWDITVVKEVRDVYPDIPIMVDANSAYSLKDKDKTIMRSLDRFDLMMIEQPLAFDDMLDHKLLQSEIETPICLDESIHSVNHAIQAINYDCARIINIKPARVGGYSKAIEIAENLGSGKVWLGGMLETGIGRMHNLFVQARDEYSIPGDTSGSNRYFERDIINPQVTVNKNGTISLPKGKNLGVEVDEEFIKQKQTRYAEYRR